MVRDSGGRNEWNDTAREVVAFPHFTGTPTSSDSLSLSLCQEFWEALYTHDPILFSPPSEVGATIDLYCNLPNFIQLMIVWILISIPDWVISPHTLFPPSHVAWWKAIIRKQNLPSLVSWSWVAFWGLPLAVSSEPLAVALPLTDLWFFSSSRSCRKKRNGWSWPGKWVFEAQSPGWGDLEGKDSVSGSR